MISNSVPFFDPIIITQPVNKESFATLGRFVENLLNVKTTYRTHTITWISSVGVKVVSSTEETTQHWLKCALKIAALVIIFPVTLIALGIKSIYRKLNQFVVETTIEKNSYRKLNLDELYAKGQEAVKAGNHKEAVECFGRFCMMSNGKQDDRKSEVIDLFYAHLKHFDTSITLPKKRNLENLKYLFAQFKEHSLITDAERVKAKLSTLGKVTLTPAKVRSDVVTDFTDIVLEYNGHKILLADQEKLHLGFTYTAYTTQGKRKAQEDSFKSVEIPIKQAGREEFNACLFMIADGHDGNQKGFGQKCSKFIVDNLPQMIQESLNSKASFSDLDVMNALKLASVRLNDEWKESKNFFDNKLGSTLCFALAFKDPILNKDVVWVGNVGDTRIIADIDHKAVQMTTDAHVRDESQDTNPVNKQFLTSVNIRSGRVDQERLNGVEPLRVIGHNDNRGFSARPEIQKFVPSDYKHCRLLMFSDGVSEVIGSEEAVAMTTKIPVQEASNRLVAVALARGGNDNITAVSIDLKR